MKSLPPHSNQVTASRYCYLEGEIHATKTLRVACAGVEQCNRFYLVEREGFPCFGLEFVAEGTGQLILNGHSYPLHAGIVFGYGPGIRHRISTDSDRPMTKYFVNFFGRGAADLFKASKLPPDGVLQIPDVGTFRFLFDQLITEGLAVSDTAAGLCAAYLRVLLMKASAGIAPTHKAGSLKATQFHRCLEFVDKHYLRLRDLNDIAVELGVRPAQLCRLFSQYGRTGPFHYLTHKKMNHAAELLAAGRLSVKETAAEVGYPDPYHFSRLFKRHFGRAPLHFQRLFHRTGGTTAAGG